MYREIKQEYKDHNYKNKTLIFLLEIDMDVSYANSEENCTALVCALITSSLHSTQVRQGKLTD